MEQSIFSIEKIEDVDNVDDLEDREIYWIEKYNSFHNGYNATLGGDGKHYLDYDSIIESYKRLQNMKAVSRELNICDDTVKKVLDLYNIPIKSSGEIARERNSISIDQYDLNNNFIQTFNSTIEAAKTLGLPENNYAGTGAHIRDVCRGIRKTAYGYKWRFTDPNQK